MCPALHFFSKTDNSQKISTSIWFSYNVYVTWIRKKPTCRRLGSNSVLWAVKPKLATKSSSMAR